MLRSGLYITLIILAATAVAGAQTYAGVDMTRADQMLENVYDTIFARASTFVTIASLIGALGALFMVSSHIYGRLLRGKAIQLDVILRPIVIMFALILYTPLINTVNAVLNPTVTATKAMVSNERDVLRDVMDQLADTNEDTEQAAMYGSLLNNGSFNEYIERNNLDSGFLGSERVGQFLAWRAESITYHLRIFMREAFFQMFSFLYFAVVFCLNVIRTFTLSVLALIGPLAIGFSLWPSFSGSFSNWLGRYIGVYLWLPVANIFGFLIATVMVEFQAIQLETVLTGGDAVTFSSLDVLYLIMLVAGIIGYIAIPSITAYIITASGASALLSGTVGAGKAAAAAAATGGMTLGKTITVSKSTTSKSSGGGGGNGGGHSKNNRLPQVAGQRPSR